jgi:hypothetical protein
MPIKVSANSKGQSDPVPAGSHHAVCYGVVAIGTQPSEKFTPRQKVVILWELPQERGDFGEKKDVPRAISKTYTLSLNDRATLRHDLENWRGKPFTAQEAGGFDVDRLIGANCMLSVVHTVKEGRTFANVSALMPLPKGMKPTQPETPRLYFNLVEAVDKAMVDGTEVVWPENMPEWLKNRASTSEEYQAHVNGTANPPPAPEAPATVPAEDESVPF